MALKKQEFTDDEIPIFEDALVYKRGDYWQMRMWLAKEHKYARFSLKTRNKSTAIDKATRNDVHLMLLDKPEFNKYNIGHYNRAVRALINLRVSLGGEA